MHNAFNDAVSKLSAITEQDPIDWEALDSVLRGLENINLYDEQEEDTILSEILMSGGFYKRGELLADIVRHFLACGYDVSANGGMNGGMALHALCWSSYDHRFLDAAKVLMNAGAPVNYRRREDDPNEEPEGLLGSISWKLDGAWVIDKDDAFANTLGAYYAMTEAHLAGKDYNSIDTYFACIGKPLAAVSAIKKDTGITLQKEGIVSVYAEPLILWFGDKPLVISCYTDFVVNPVYADDKKADLVDVSSEFSALIGATLKEIQYIGSTICYFEFSNGMRLIFASRDIGNRKRVGTLEIRTQDDSTDIEHLNIDCFCGQNGHTFASTVTDYREDAIALFCGDESYLLYPRSITADDDRFQLDLCPCSRALLTEYTRQYPLKCPAKITSLYEQDNLSAVRLDFAEGFLYLRASEFYGIEVQLSNELYNPLEYSTLRNNGKGKHMEFQKRKL